MSTHKGFFILSMILILVAGLTIFKDLRKYQDSLPTFADKNTSNAKREINFAMKQDSEFELPFYRSQADSAMKIAKAVFNSDTFQNKILQLNFKHNSYCRQRKSCKRNERDNGSRISGQEVLNDLFKEQNVQLSLYVESNGDALGRTCPNEYAITMFYNNIMEDMKDDSIPPSYKLAVNLCHEYMHQVGYCHIYDGLREKEGLPDSRYMYQDVTYTVGWEAYYTLRDWYSKGKKIPNL